MKKSDRNLSVIQNFILHLTHCGDHGMDAEFKDVKTYTPELLYQIAKDYIEEDHVDGKDNPEDEIITCTYGAESSFDSEDIDKEYDEHIVVVADYGEEHGTQTIATFNCVDELEALQELLEHVNNPEVQ